MAQITIYLEDSIAKQLKKAAEETNISQSKLVSQLIQNRLSTEWPKAVKNTTGAWQEFPTAEQLRENVDEDLPREAL